MLSFMVRDGELERQWLQITADNWRTSAAAAIARQRARLSAWPGVLVGAGLTGILLLDLRRRQRQDGWLDREDMERKFEDGRPVGFKPDERASPVGDVRAPSE